MKTEIYLNRKEYIPVLFTLLVFLTGIAMVQDVYTQDTFWTQKADMPDGRHSFATCVLNDRIYAMCGRYANNLLLEYDPANDTWLSKGVIPFSRMLLSACAVDGKIYAIGGLAEALSPAMSTVKEYNPATNVWMNKKNMSTRRLAFGACVVDGKIYAMGGMTSGSNFWSDVHCSVEVYDPQTDTWSNKSDMPTARVWFTTSVVEGKIYAIGGILVTKEVLSTVEVYDPATDTWTTKSPMPTPRAGHVAAVVDGIIYVIGGGSFETGKEGYTLVEAYNPSTDTWSTTEDIPAKRAFACADTMNGKIYVLGGISTFADPHLHGTTTMYEYDPSKEITGVEDPYMEKNCLAQIKLYQNYPNPFITSTTIQFDLQKPDHVTVKVYDSLGKEVRILADKFMDPGLQSFKFDAGKLPGNLYIYELQTNNLVEARKMLLIK